MDNPVAKKTCKMCCMEIPQQARKCPYCLHFQKRCSISIYNPLVLVLFGVLLMIALMIWSHSLFDQGENYETYKKQIAVTESQIVFGETKSGATVAVIGTITNTSQISWKEVQFHVDFLGATGKRVDVGEREDYVFRLPAGKTSSFKLSFRREFPETNYVRPVVNVIGAKDARAIW